MMGSFQLLLATVAKDAEQRAWEMALLTAEQQEQELVEWNRTEAEYTRAKTEAELLAEQAKRTTEATAVVCEGRTLNYRELDERSNQLGHYLRGLGVGPEVLVGLCVERSLEMLVGLLGILKAGGAYLPLDPTYPRDRIAFMLADSKAPVLVSQQGLLAGLPNGAVRMVCLDSDWPATERHPATAPPTAGGAESL